MAFVDFTCVCKMKPNQWSAITLSFSLYWCLTKTYPVSYLIIFVALPSASTQYDAAKVYSVIVCLDARYDLKKLLRNGATSLEFAVGTFINLFSHGIGVLIFWTSYLAVLVSIGHILMIRTCQSRAAKQFLFCDTFHVNNLLFIRITRLKKKNFSDCQGYDTTADFAHSINGSCSRSEFYTLKLTMMSGLNSEILLIYFVSHSPTVCQAILFSELLQYESCTVYRNAYCYHNTVMCIITFCPP